ncbi:MAG: hypothetical protein ACRC2T_11020 [Thermoguttaceae bacterium]
MTVWKSKAKEKSAMKRIKIALLKKSRPAIQMLPVYVSRGINKAPV